MPRLSATGGDCPARGRGHCRLDGGASLSLPYSLLRQGLIAPTLLDVGADSPAAVDEAPEGVHRLPALSRRCRNLLGASECCGRDRPPRFRRCRRRYSCQIPLGLRCFFDAKEGVPPCSVGGGRARHSPRCSPNVATAAAPARSVSCWSRSLRLLLVRSSPPSQSPNSRSGLRSGNLSATPRSDLLHTMLPLIYRYSHQMT